MIKTKKVEPNKLSYPVRVDEDLFSLLHIQADTLPLWIILEKN